MKVSQFRNEIRAPRILAHRYQAFSLQKKRGLIYGLFNGLMLFGMIYKVLSSLSFLGMASDLYAESYKRGSREQKE